MTTSDRHQRAHGGGAGRVGTPEGFLRANFRGPGR